jgi:hypothetical protein
MSVGDLVFITSLLFVVVLVVRVLVALVRRRSVTARRASVVLGTFVGCYAAVLIVASLTRPRALLGPDERECFDDWCVAAERATIASNTTPCSSLPGTRIWTAELEVSSAAKRIRQRARDAHAELEDRQGRRYQPCAGPVAGETAPNFLSDELGPGDSFRVLLPFRLPDNTQPVGAVVHHGQFPDVIIIGADQSFLHPPTLMRLAVAAGKP